MCVFILLHTRKERRAVLLCVIQLSLCFSKFSRQLLDRVPALVNDPDQSERQDRCGRRQHVGPVRLRSDFLWDIFICCVGRGVNRKKDGPTSEQAA